MEGSSWRPNLATADSSSGGGEWRQQLLPEARERIVNKIMDTLKRHLPISGPDGLSELKKIAVRFEEKIYAAATNQSDYLRKISLKMLSMETKTQGIAAINPSLSNPVIGNPNPSESDQQLRDPLLEQWEQLKLIPPIQAQQLLRLQQVVMQQQQQLQQLEIQAQLLLRSQQKREVLHQSLMQQQLHQQNHQQMAPMPVNQLTQLHQMNARQAFGAGLYRQNYPWGQNHNYYQPQNPGTLFPISQSSSLISQHNLSSSHPATGVPLLSANTTIGIAPSPTPGDTEKQSGTSKFKISEKPRNEPQPRTIQGENVAAFKIRVAALQNRVTALEMRVWIFSWIIVFVVFEVLFANVMVE